MGWNQVLVELPDGRRALFAPAGTSHDELVFGPSSEEGVVDRTYLRRPHRPEQEDEDPIAWPRRIRVKDATVETVLEQMESGFDFMVCGQDSRVIVEFNQITTRSAARLTSMISQTVNRGRQIAETERGADRFDGLEIWLLSLDRWQLRILHFDPARDFDRTWEEELKALAVWSYPENGAEATGEPGNAVTTRYIEYCIAEWIDRIERLYSSVEAALGSADFVYERRKDVLMDELMMRRYAVPPQTVPLLDVWRKHNRHLVMSIVPYARWVIDAQGLLDLFTPLKRFGIVDAGEPGKAPHWMLVPPEPGVGKTPLNRETIRELLAHEPAE